MPNKNYTPMLQIDLGGHSHSKKSKHAIKTTMEETTIEHDSVAPTMDSKEDREKLPKINEIIQEEEVVTNIVNQNVISVRKNSSKKKSSKRVTNALENNASATV